MEINLKQDLNMNFSSVLSNKSILDNALLDDPYRLELNQSLWLSATHFKEKTQLNNQIQVEVKDFFEKEYSFRDKKNFQKIWKEVEADQIWTPKNTLTVGKFRKIDSLFKEKLIYHGEGIKTPTYSNSITPTVQNLVKALLHGGKFSDINIHKKEIKAIISQLDPSLMHQFQEALQIEMDHLFTNLPQNEKQEVVWRAFLGSILALLPFSYPENNKIFTIPILENGVCRQVEYKTEVINLSYDDHLTPMTALALTPENGTMAPPILSFIGTTFPAGNGFASTLLADFTPGNSVGEFVYKRNQEKIDAWLKDKKGVHVVGMSLGGAMALHTLRNHHEIGRVDAYVPPGLNSNNWKEGIGSTCKVNIYCHPGDLVSKFGSWPTGDNVSLYTIYPHQNGISENPLGSHVRVFTGCEALTIIKEDPKEMNGSFFRQFLTKLHLYLSPTIYLPLCLIVSLYQLAAKIQKICLMKFNRLFYSKSNKSNI